LTAILKFGSEKIKDIDTKGVTGGGNQQEVGRGKEGEGESMIEVHCRHMKSHNE
jgi:hypothetical protein